MKQTFRSMGLAVALCTAAGAALAQTSLRIGLGDDPDGLDPTTSRFYTTRIVFAALCDKLNASPVRFPGSPLRLLFAVAGVENRTDR